MAITSRRIRSDTDSTVRRTASDRDMADALGDYRVRNRSAFTSRAVVFAIIALAFLWSVWGTGFGVMALVRGLAVSVDFVVTDLLPPRLSAVPSLLQPTLETLYMSYVGMVMSVVLSLPLAVLAARNVTVSRIVAYYSKATAAFIRALPDLVLAILLVAVFGIGPLAGTLALGIGGVGILGKAYADGIEEIDMRQLEGLRASGATWLQILGQGVWPQFKPTFITWSLYRLDLNIRAAAVLGLVGAGGIGHSLNGYLNLFQFKSASAAILMIFTLILVVEYITGQLRRRLL